MSAECVVESPAFAPSAAEPLDLDGRLCGDVDALDDFAPAFLRRRVNADQKTVEHDLAKLVLSLIDLVRQLMERQAIRRVDAGSLSEDEVERVGETFLKLNERMAELCTAFGLQPEDLKLNLGPIRDLL